MAVVYAIERNGGYIFKDNMLLYHFFLYQCDFYMTLYLFCFLQDTHVEPLLCFSSVAQFVLQTCQTENELLPKVVRMRHNFVLPILKN